MFKLEGSSINNPTQSINVDLQQEAKSIVLEEMEKMGLMSKIKSQIKMNVLKILEKQKQSVKQNLEFDYITPLHKQNKNKEILLAYHVIKEFMQFYELEYTLPIFENESNIREDLKRETLLSELSLKNNPVNENKPVLVQLINSYLHDVNNKKSLNVSQKLDESYGIRGGLLNVDIHSVVDETTRKNEILSSLGLPPLNVGNLPPSGLGGGKKVLSPISFTNKSVELKESQSPTKNSELMKFNTANLNDIYSNPLNNFNNNMSQNGTSSNNISNIKNKEGLNSDDSDKNKNKTISPTENLLFSFNPGEYSTNNKYDEEFSEVIMEDIPEVKFTPNAKNDEIEDSKKSLTGNSTSNLGFDSSVTNYNLNEFDYVEDVDILK